MRRQLATATVFACLSAASVWAQAGGARPSPAAPPPPGVPVAGAGVATAAGAPSRGTSGVLTSTDFRIGPEDVLDIVVWKNAELTRTVAVRPDGRISLPLLNDIPAAGLTPMELRDTIAAGYKPYVNELEVSVHLREIHSLKVSVIGMVRLPGRYELRSQATVLEALALAGGLTEYAKRDRIAVFRHDGRQWQRYAFDYSYVINENAEQNFVLRAGDIVVVP
jgi:polysaccharide export outer membrane protein